MYMILQLFILEIKFVYSKQHYANAVFSVVKSLVTSMYLSDPIHNCLIVKTIMLESDNHWPGKVGGSSLYCQQVSCIHCTGLCRTKCYCKPC